MAKVVSGLTKEDIFEELIEEIKENTPPEDAFTIAEFAEYMIEKSDGDFTTRKAEGVLNTKVRFGEFQKQKFKNSESGNMAWYYWKV